MDLNNIIDIGVDIQNPSPPVGAGDCLLIIGLPPVTEKEKPPLAVGIYFSLEEVEAVGFVCDGDNADPVGVAARVAFQQNLRPYAVYIAIRQEGDEVAFEPITETLDRAYDVAGWYTVCPAGIGVDEYEEIAEWTESKEKMFAYTYLSNEDPIEPKYFRSHGWCGLLRDESNATELPDECHYVHVAVTAKCLSYDAGSETWAFKEVHGLPRIAVSKELRNEIVEDSSNAFVNVSGHNYTVNGMVRGGEWIDVIRGRDWLQTEMRMRIFRLLASEPKIAYLETGLAKIQNEIIATLKSAQDRNIVQVDEYDERGGLIPGFTVTVPRAASIAPEQRQMRKLSGIQWRARLAGAIHVVEVSGTLSY